MARRLHGAAPRSTGVAGAARGARPPCLGKLYVRQKKYGEAEPLIRRALTIRERAGNETEVTFVLDDLGRIKRAQGSYAEAEPLIRRALEVREKALHPDHPFVADTLDNLAELYAAQARYADAAVLYRRALHIREKALPADHPDIAAILENFAALLRKTSRGAEAIKLEVRWACPWRPGSSTPRSGSS